MFQNMKHVKAASATKENDIDFKFDDQMEPQK